MNVDPLWAYWAIGLAIGLPVLLISLTEWQQFLARREQRPGRAGQSVAQLPGAVGGAAGAVGQGGAGARPGRLGAGAGDGIRFRGAAPAVVGAQRHGVRRSAAGLVAPAGADDIPGRHKVFADCGRPRADLLLRLGRARRWLVHRARRDLGGHRLDAAELRRSDRVRVVHAVRAAVPDRGLAGHADRARTHRGSELARRPHPDRPRSADHAELGAGRDVVHQPQPPARRAQAVDQHHVLGRGST